VHKLCLIQFKKTLLEGRRFRDVVVKARGKWEGKFEDKTKKNILGSHRMAVEG